MASFCPMVHSGGADEAVVEAVSSDATIWYRVLRDCYCLLCKLLQQPSFACSIRFIVAPWSSHRSDSETFTRGHKLHHHRHHDID